MTRRQALGLAAAAAAALESGLPPSQAAASGGDIPRDRSFDESWLFLRGDADGAESPSYDGRALAVLRPGKQPGHITLTATAPGLRPATLTLPVKNGKSE
ncbi:hypothetical protein [Streptomyces sasae]|uniref:hypothetical protein n=1 Tax=Streptomyces sasae TaxID=1266772 RepID=UPI00292CFF98|nr:hypothetical protein [Streptomyces sasae]